MSQIKVNWNRATQNKLKVLPKKIVEEIATDTLGKTYPTIPMSSALERNTTRGRLRRDTVAKGVQSNGNVIFLESPSYYAKFVWNMNDSKTNWSTPGTGSKWFEETWKKQGNSIEKKAVERNKL